MCMIKYYLFVFVFAFLFYNEAQAQTAEVKGIVKGKETRASLKDVLVNIDKINMKVYDVYIISIRYINKRYKRRGKC